MTGAKGLPAVPPGHDPECIRLIHAESLDMYPDSLNPESKTEGKIKGVCLLVSNL
jgi:hypothetical protein